jgi:hypothetical protein
LRHQRHPFADVLTNASRPIYFDEHRHWYDVHNPVISVIPIISSFSINLKGIKLFSAWGTSLTLPESPALDQLSSWINVTSGSCAYSILQ